MILSDQDKFLSTQKLLRLATISYAGIPHVVPVWYMYESSTIYIGTNTKTKKAKNITHNTHVSFCIDQGVNAPNICGVAGHGVARLITQDQYKIRDIAIKILSRYYDDDIHDSPAALELLKDTDCIIEIIPKNMTMWRY